MPEATFTALKGGRNIDNNARKRVAEKNVDEMPKIQKNILFVLDIEIVFTIIPKCETGLQMVCDAFRSNEKICQTYDLKLRENADILLCSLAD